VLLRCEVRQHATVGHAEGDANDHEVDVEREARRIVVVRDVDPLELCWHGAKVARADPEPFELDAMIEIGPRVTQALTLCAQ
jgi:hypothetical protein